MTHTEIIAAWNAQADHMNQWDELCEQEKVEWARRCALEEAIEVALFHKRDHYRMGGLIARSIQALKDKP